MSTKLGINGFGRIGRQVFRAVNERLGRSLSIVAINDLFDTRTNAALLKYDSNYGTSRMDIGGSGNDLVVDGSKIRVERTIPPNRHRENASLTRFMVLSLCCVVTLLDACRELFPAFPVI